MASITEFSRLSAILTMDIAGFLRNTEIAQNKLQKFGAAATQIGSRLSRGLGLAFGLIGGGAVNTAAEFNKVSVQLRALVDQNSFERLSAQAKVLGETTIFTRTEITNAQKELAKLGTTGSDIESILPSIANLSGALDEDLTKSATAVKEALNIFGLSADRAQGVTDLFAQAIKSSALTIPRLRESLKNVGPILRQQNLDIEQSVALLALLSNNAISGSIGGTKLRSTFNRLAPIYSEAGVALQKFNDENLKYTDILEILKSRAAVVGAIIADQGDVFADLTAYFKEATGATDTLAAEFDGELFFTVEQLKNAVQNLGIEIGNALVPTMNGLRDVAVSLSRSFSDLSPATKRFLGLIVTIIPLIAAATFAVGQLSLVLGALSGPIGLVITGLALLGVALTKAFAGTAQRDNDIRSIQENLERTSEELENLDKNGGKVSLDKATRIEASTLSDLEKLQFDIRNTRLQLADLESSSRATNFLADLFGEGQGDLLLLLDDMERLERELNAQLKQSADAVELENKRVEARKALNKIFADGLKLQQIEEDAIEKASKAAKRYESVLRQANNQLESVRIDQLTSQEQEIAKINLRFKNFAERLQEVGKGTQELEEIRQKIIGILTAAQRLDDAEFLQGLKASTEALTNTDFENTLAKIQKKFSDLRKEAAERKGVTEEALVFIDQQELIETGRAFADFYDGLAAKQKDTKQQLLDFTGTALEQEVAAINAQRDKILRENELTQDQRVAVIEAAAKKVAKLEQDYAFQAQQTALNALAPLRDLANTIGNTFSNALTNGTNFFQELGKSFLRFFSAIIGKVVALIALFAVLNVLSGGIFAGTGIAKTSSAALGGNNLGQFIALGLGANTGVSGGSPGFRLAGGDLVLSSERSGRAFTRVR